MGSIQGQHGAETSVLAPLPINPALSAPWDFLRPTKKLRTGVLNTAKIFLDSLAGSVCDSQTTRQRNTRKRKRADDEASVLRLKQLYVDGFTSDQVWEQALLIFDSADHEIQRDYTIWANDRQSNTESLYRDDVDSVEDGFSDELEDVTEDGSDNDEQNEEQDTGAENVSQIDLDESGVGMHGLDGSSVDGGDNDRDTYVEDRFGLNDGFFSIDDFNKQTEQFERQDARGDVDDESDDDEINWHADPLGAGGLGLSSQKKADKADDDRSDSDEEEDGPTFDNMGAEDDSEMDEDDSHAAALGGAGFSNTSDIMYADFFAPPPRKAPTKKSRPLPKTQPRITDNDIDRAMADVRRDLFDDEISAEESGDEPSDIHTHKSTHEKQRARIADEIRRLEAVNVAKKEWMVSGEARAVERPINSLIEEDLDFERIGKPVPVVTTELSESIEELIKRRIIAKEFDEVIRRRPGLSDQQNTQKSRIELEDSKSQQGLAEIYESDHIRATDSNYADPKNQKLLKEHTEVANLWKEISSQLDTLSNWHYKPKAPQASINVVTDVATITMEDAQPTAGGAVRTSASLAPQEIYAPGETARAPGEVVMRNGVPFTKEEMTREEKAKLRRRQKKLGHVSGDASTQRSGKAVEKQQIISNLKKAGVKLIGKEGDVTDITGGRVAGMSDRTGAHAVKL
ncbi:rRNA-processing protein MPP10 [Aspergillus mulundensis]|uniref:U3 small nucleolar ribonucleoprotein protein MPP10 n=1 Tax=Aspergillus mulundensis TaxID=1810919 RepID=A0A3D8QC03_9EURO|nr:U3 small nucleolar ribonucleoprotein MPP10 [Aspergillus mulundensis]RDW59395.1 U3 small nucleolar ribonucleoprotein MPP10 [Aspergillus mulundensis]